MRRMSTYELLKILHIALALISGLGFALRGFIRLVLQRPLAHPLVRFGPHLVDTVLLASGVGCGSSWVCRRWRGDGSGSSCCLVVVYIAVGITAFRIRHPGIAVLAYLAALGVFLSVAWLALFKPL